MNGFFIGSPVLPIFVARRRRSKQAQRRVSELSEHSSDAVDTKSMKTQATSSSKATCDSTGIRRRSNRLRRFLTFKKDADFEERKDDKTKRKPVKEYAGTSYDHYADSMQCFTWF